MSSASQADTSLSGNIASAQASPTSPSRRALQALANAQNLANQQNPAIWFDSWGNDLRDNNLNGAIDDATEQGISDGIHYKKPFKGYVCGDASVTTDKCGTSKSLIDVQYKVCIDVPIESYGAVPGTNVSTNRNVSGFFAELKTKPNWRVSGGRRNSAGSSLPSPLLDGDIVAEDVNSTTGHAGMIVTGALADSVINLPGPTSQRTYRVFTPSGKNDMMTVPKVAFELVKGIDWVARLIDTAKRKNDAGGGGSSW